MSKAISVVIGLARDRILPTAMAVCRISSSGGQTWRCGGYGSRWQRRGLRHHRSHPALKYNQRRHRTGNYGCDLWCQRARLRRRRCCGQDCSGSRSCTSLRGRWPHRGIERARHRWSHRVIERSRHRRTRPCGHRCSHLFIEFSCFRWWSRCGL